jgi:biofilm PGA synthesis N-glycosyltransferase PgaC
MRLLFWTSVAGILYTYAGYPAAIWLLSRVAGRPVSRRPILPSVSVVVPCYNEEGNIEARIKNLEASDYPAGNLEIIVVSDGSTDSTEAAATEAASIRTTVLAYPGRKGKAAALNFGIQNSSGEVIVFADARQRFEPRAIRELVENLADETVGAVTGELMLTNEERSQLGEAQAFYWKYEKWIRKSESRFDSTIGATGAIYAIRKSLWNPLPDSTILDDVYTPMMIALSGSRVVFEHRARAYDEAASSGRQEFVRKARTLTGNYQLCQLLPRLLVPTHRLAIQFYSHKLMRLIAPIFLIVCLASNVAISITETAGVRSIYDGVLAAQAGFYLLVVAGWTLRGSNPGVRLAKAAYAFCLMNAAALVGLLNFITGKRDVWTRTD